MSTQRPNNNLVADEKDVPEEFRGHEVERGNPYEFKPGSVLIGTLLRLKEVRGKREGTSFHLATIVDGDGESFLVTAGAILGDILLGVTIGSRVRIEYLGEVDTPRGKAKNFRVHAVEPK